MMSKSGMVLQVAARAEVTGPVSRSEEKAIEDKMEQVVFISDSRPMSGVSKLFYSSSSSSNNLGMR